MKEVSSHVPKDIFWMIACDSGFWASLGAKIVKNPPTVQETWVPSQGWGDPLEKGTATHSSILARRIPRTEETGRLQSMGLQSQTWLSDFHFLSLASNPLFAYLIPISSPWVQQLWCQRVINRAEDPHRDVHLLHIHTVCKMLTASSHRLQNVFRSLKKN